ncbi:MAG: tRNA uridine-5-carboxymethylaminomethyl(34) synthesis GTPase MnmE [Chromatiales bacterium]|nr:tRNA uridine-5-carboxymethylaminomethyl(34) synthesis GTPase MnmE [Chromatiales bacterium]
MSPRDTIAAVATASGRGAIAIVRVSGPAVSGIAGQLFTQPIPVGRFSLATARSASGESIDRGLALLFRAPRSFTGEDVLEFHGHGGSVVCDAIIERVLELGARLAEPGEFTLRAFENGKLDLAQAEAVADLIDAGSRRAARAAMRSLDGEFSRRIQALADELLNLRVWIEAGIDFSEEDIDFIARGEVQARVVAISTQIDAILVTAGTGRALREGLSIVLAGRPNAGKSTLLNTLAGTDAAIVTDTPGTTRDLLREQIDLDGVPLTVIDTAGLRASENGIERIGVERALAAVERADYLLWISDDSDPESAPEADLERWRLGAAARVIVHNKIDRSGRQSGRVLSTDPEFAVSCSTGAGLAALRAGLRELAGDTGEAGAFIARRRHLDALRRAQSELAAAASHLTAGDAPELAAEALRLSHAALGEITGRVSSDQLLGEIFSGFCIGK